MRKNSDTHFSFLPQRPGLPMNRGIVSTVGLMALVIGSFAGEGNKSRQGGAPRIATFAGRGHAGYSGDGGPAADARLNNPYGIARGPDGGLYVCDMNNHVLRKVSPDGTISTIAGTGKRGYTGDGGPATRAQLNEPYEIRSDRKGNLFFVERLNHVVRRVNIKDRTISTVAGTGEKGFSGDGGLATKAKLSEPHSLQFDKAGNLYICDIGNHRIRKVDMQTGLISTFAGTGDQAATPDGARIEGTPLNGPRAIDFDKDGNLWLALREGNAVYMLDMKTRTLHHVAGTGKEGSSGDGGPARQATLSGPKGLSVGPDGNIYLADTESHTIRMINLANLTMERVAGTGERGDGPDGDPLTCKLARPHGIFVDSDGFIFVGDSESHRVRKISRVK
jgi:streptogramin lyase